MDTKGFILTLPSTRVCPPFASLRDIFPRRGARRHPRHKMSLPEKDRDRCGLFLGSVLIKFLRRLRKCALDASECLSKDERSTGTPNVTALATLMKEWYFQPARPVSL